MATTRKGGDNNKSVTPGRDLQPNISPQNLDNHSFILQTIMEMQRSMGGVEQSVKDMKTTLDDVSDTVSSHGKYMFAASVVITIAIVMGGFFLDKFWDNMEASIQKISKLPEPKD